MGKHSKPVAWWSANGWAIWLGLAVAILAWAIAGIITGRAESRTDDVEPSATAWILGQSGNPTPDAEYVDTAVDSYLTPLGFDGDAKAFTTPEEYSNASYVNGEDKLTDSIESAYDSGQFDAGDPLWLFGYSQSATIISESEDELAAYGIPSDAINIVLVGDPASAQGGFVESAPNWLMEWFGYDYLADAEVTPDSYYDTSVFTIPGDGWADYSSPWGIFAFQHGAYMGLDPDVIQQTLADGPDAVDGMTDYYTIDPADFDLWDALWDFMF